MLTIIAGCISRRQDTATCTLRFEVECKVGVKLLSIGAFCDFSAHSHLTIGSHLGASSAYVVYVLSIALVKPLHSVVCAYVSCFGQVVVVYYKRRQPVVRLPGPLKFVVNLGKTATARLAKTQKVKQDVMGEDVPEEPEVP